MHTYTRSNTEAHSLHVVCSNALVVANHALFGVVVGKEEFSAQVREEHRDGYEVSGWPEIVVGAAIEGEEGAKACWKVWNIKGGGKVGLGWQDRKLTTVLRGAAT